MSVFQRAVELMQARIDGAITDEENAELDGFLKQDPGLEKRFFELQWVADELDSMPRVDPPASLRAAVLESIGSSESESSRQSRSRAGVVPRYVYAAAAGLILGALGYHVATHRPFQRPTIDPAEFAGTMSAPPAAAMPEVVDEISVDLASVRGTAQLALAGSRVVLQVELDSRRNLDVVLALDAAELGFRDFVQHRGEIDALAVKEHSVAWSQRGPHHVTAVFTWRGQTPATIELRLIERGVDIFTKSLVVSESVSTPGP